MKKVIVILSALVLSASAANAQGWLDSFLKVATESVGDILSGKGTATTFDIKGTWKYQGVAIGATSDNVLASVATAAGTGKVEEQVNKLLAKAGIKAGAATLSFNNDGSFSLNSGKLAIPGTWTKDGDKLTINFAKIFTFKLVGTIKTNSTGCEILFESNKFLEFVKKVMEVVGQATNNSTMTTVQQAIANIKELKLGFKLSK